MPCSCLLFNYKAIINFSLSDIDDCLAAALMNTDLCESDANTQCVNLDGSYDCTCAFGFERVNGTCLCKLRKNF